MASGGYMDGFRIPDELLRCIDEMSPEKFFQYAVLKLDTMDATEKDLKLLEYVVYKTNELMQRFKKKSQVQDLRANFQHMDSPSFIPGLTLMEQSPASTSTLRGQFTQEASNENRYITDCLPSSMSKSRNLGDGIPSSRNSGYYTENYNRLTYR